MSGLDPLLSDVILSLSKDAEVVEGLSNAALDLGIPAELLQAQLRIGDLLDAIVLPPQNGHDLIEILGHEVAAQLPPDVHPGERLVLQVTGFSGRQLFVRNLGQPDPQNPPSTVNVVVTKPNETVSSPSHPEVSRRDRMSLVSADPRGVLADKDPEVIEGRRQQQPIAPPRSVFVAASVRQSTASPTSQQSQTPAPAAFISHEVAKLDARIAAAQTSRAIAPQTPVPAAATLPAAIRAQVQNAVQQIAQQTVRTVSDLLKALRVPDTPFTRTAAAIAPQAPMRISSVLQRLEAALPKESADPRIATLKTLIAFTSNINPANEETLPAQIASYMSNVVEGAEPKMQQMLTALASKASPHSVAHATLAQAHAIERAAAIDHDLKSVVLSLLRDPGGTRTPALTQALNETLLTLTGTQFNALSSQTQSPGAVSLTLPVVYHEGGKPAQIRISRDGQSRSEKLDADNFHVAFVLDTANLGTVAIDLQTVGRSVKVDVKTEGRKAASRFSETLDSLRTRLEALRYRVSSVAAAALTRHCEVPNACHREVSNPEVSKGMDALSQLDLRA